MKNYWLGKGLQEEVTSVYAMVNQGMFSLSEEPSRTDVVRIRQGIINPSFFPCTIHVPSNISNLVFSEDMPIFVWKCPICSGVFETNSASSYCITCRFSPMKLLDATLS